MAPGILPLLLALLLPSLPAAALEVIRDNQTYLVRGDNAEEIRASLDRLGPVAPSTGRRFDAYTRWRLEWRYDSRSSWRSCEITRVWTQLKVTMLLPLHGRPSALAEPLRQEWTRYLQRLALHEEGHARIPSEAARELEIALDRLERPDCQALEQAANRLGQEALQRARAAEGRYDVETDHGRAQGARFPWTEGDSTELTASELRKLRDRTPAPPAGGGGERK